MTYQIGLQVPLDYARTIQGKDMPKPQWYAIRVRANSERKVREYLKARGIHACYPDREVSWVIRGKRHRRRYPVITQIVYVKFHREPQWDVMKARNLILGVFSYEGQPIVLHKDIIAAVMGLPTEAEKLEKAHAELMRLRKGDKARFTGGVFEGEVIDVTSTSEGRIWFETISGISGTTTPDKLRKLLPDAK